MHHVRQLKKHLAPDLLADGGSLLDWPTEAALTEHCERALDDYAAIGAPGRSRALLLAEIFGSSLGAQVFMAKIDWAAPGSTTAEMISLIQSYSPKAN